MEDEIDLREYVAIIIRYWKWIVGAALVAAVTAGVVSFLLPPTYEATAGVLVIPSKSEVSFEPKFKTLSGEDLAQGRVFDVNSRRKALEALAKSTSVAAQVIAQLQTMLEPEEQEVLTLLETVDVESTGDLIEIKVRADSPAKAATIANAWGKAYESYVNDMYGGVVESTTNIQAQLTTAKAEYDAAEAALQGFIGDNRIAELQREIGAKEARIKAVKDAQTEAGTSLYSQQLQTKQATLGDYYAATRRLEQLLADAEALREQLHTRGTSSSAVMADGLALMLLRAGAFAAHAGLPVQLQISMEQMAGREDDKDQQLEDVDSLIAVLKKQREQAQAAINRLSLEILNSKTYPLSPPADDPATELIQNYTQEVLKLKEELEVEVARQRELTRQRDLTWDTYTTLARKAAEIGVASQVKDTEVRFAVSAVEPEKPVSPKKKQNVALAGALGLFIGVFGAFAVNYFSEEDGAAG